MKGVLGKKRKKENEEKASHKWLGFDFIVAVELNMIKEHWSWIKRFMSHISMNIWETKK